MIIYIEEIDRADENADIRPFYIRYPKDRPYNRQTVGQIPDTVQIIVISLSRSDRTE